MKNSLLIRNLQEHELPQMLQKAEEEGWNPGLRDAEAFFYADPEGFWVGELNGLPVAYIAAVNYRQKYGFVGLYIVDKAHRGKGYGYQVWKHALQRIEHLVCGLDGVPEQVENYKKSGFVYAHQQMRLACMAINVKKPEAVTCVNTEHIEKVLSYDTEVFGVNRMAFIRSWLNMKNATSFLVEEEGKIKGYAVLRKCSDGYKIGPLFADDETVAEQLFLACHASVTLPDTVFIDMSAEHPITHHWMKKYQLQLAFETARMYKNGNPDYPVEKMFGVTTFELG